MKINDLSTQLNRAIATGINAAAHTALVDIQQHVAIRTGRLHDSYAITKQATPDSLEAEVASPLDYRVEQYPFQDKPRTNAPPPILGEGRFEEVVKVGVESAIAAIVLSDRF